MNSTQHVEGGFLSKHFLSNLRRKYFGGSGDKTLKSQQFFFFSLPSNQTPTKNIISPLFSHFFFFFHPLYSTSKQIYPKCLHGYIHITDLYLDQDHEIYLFILNTVYIYIYKKLKLGSKNLYPKIKN